MTEKTMSSPDHGRCAWPGCTYAGLLVGVHRRWVCAEHVTDALREIVRAGPRWPMDEDNRPTDLRWLNCLSRLIEATVLAVGDQEGLTKGKINDRMTKCCIRLPRVTFWIERHAAIGVTMQRWAFNVETEEFRRTAEKVIKSVFLNPKTGRLRCPKCRRSRLDRNPGRVRCLNCGFEVLHEHSFH